MSPILITLVALFAAVSAQVVSPCVEGQEPNYESVKVIVNGVECTESPCNLYRGTTAACQLQFTTKTPIDQIIQSVNATVLGTGVTVKYPIENAEKGCDKLIDGYCPLDAGETVTMELAFDVLKMYPKVDLLLHIGGSTPDLQEIACFALRGKVVDL